MTAPQPFLPDASETLSLPLPDLSGDSPAASAAFPVGLPAPEPCPILENRPDIFKQVLAADPASDPPEPVKPTRAAVRPKADWAAIERDYSTGRYTDLELADKHGGIVTRQAISKRARTHNWQRDLTGAVKMATRRAVLRAQVAQVQVAKQVATTPLTPDEVAKNVLATLGAPDPAAGATDATLVAVLAAAEVNKAVIMGHRTMATKLAQTGMALLQELDLITLNPDKLRALQGVLVDAKASKAQLTAAREAFTDLVRLPHRALILQRLSATMLRVQLMECRAYGLDEPDDPAAAAGEGGGTLTDAQRASRLAYLLQTRLSKNLDTEEIADASD